MDKFKRAITWIRKSLEITEKTTQPGTVSGTILPTIDAFGWEGTQTPEHTSAVGTGAAIALNLVPEGEAFLYFSASTHHTDAGGPHTLALQFLHSTGQVSWLTSTVVRILNEQAAMVRPILVPAGATLRAVSLDALGPANIILTASFFRLLPGEYFPGTPYG